MFFGDEQGVAGPDRVDVQDGKRSLIFVKFRTGDFTSGNTAENTVSFLCHRSLLFSFFSFFFFRDAFSFRGGFLLLLFIFFLGGFRFGPDDQFKDNAWGVIAQPGSGPFAFILFAPAVTAQFNDPGIAAGTVFEARRDVLDQLSGDCFILEPA